MRTAWIAAVLVLAGTLRARSQRGVRLIQDLVLPAPELEVVPVNAASPIVPHRPKNPHGTAFRYDLEYTGLDPGEYDLSKWLQPLAGASAVLSPIPVKIRSLLPAGQVLPHPPVPARAPVLGGYRAFLLVAGILWIVGLIAILRIGRKRALAAAESARPRTLAERLRPLVEHAIAGRLSRVERARLELSLVAYWRKRLGLDALEPRAALAQLREHADAGPLLRSLEDWLHAPVPAHEVDLAVLLAPYRDLPADALEMTEVRALASP
jgi:hypothetical protein